MFTLISIIHLFSIVELSSHARREDNYMICLRILLLRSYPLELMITQPTTGHTDHLIQRGSYMFL